MLQRIEFSNVNSRMSDAQLHQGHGKVEWGSQGEEAARPEAYFRRAVYIEHAVQIKHF